MSDVIGPLGWYCIGPAAAGRGYGLRSWSSDLEFTAGEMEIADKLRLAVSTWSTRPDASVAAALVPPIDPQVDRWLLLHVTVGEAGAMGSEANATGVLISQDQMKTMDWRPHVLLPALADLRPKEGSGSVKLAQSQPSRSSLPALGEILAWTDLAVISEPGAQGLARAADVIESVEPAAQRSRVRGWCAGGLITAPGPLEAHRAYALLVLPQDQIAAVNWHGLTARPEGGTFQVSGVAASPPSWRAWSMLRTALSKLGPGVRDLVRTDWRTEFNAMEPKAVLAAIMGQGVVASAPARRLDLIKAIATASAAVHATYAQDGENGWALDAIDEAVAETAGSQTFEDAGTAAAWLLGLLKTVFPHLRSPAGPAVRRAVGLGVLARLDATQIDLLTPYGLLSDLGAEVAAQLPSLAQEVRLVLLQLAIRDRVVQSPEARRLLADLLRSLSSEPKSWSGDLRRAYQEGVRLLNETASTMERPGLVAPALPALATRASSDEVLIPALSDLIGEDARMTQEERQIAWEDEDIFRETVLRAVERGKR